MPNACFIDTNILLYTKDPTTPLKRQKARAWLGALADEGLGIVSPQVLNEFAHNIIRKFPHIGYAELRESLEALRPWCLAEVTDETALQALAIHRRYRFSFYDSALLAAAVSFGCDVFLSEDLGHKQKLGDLTIINPFAVEPTTFLKEN